MSDSMQRKCKNVISKLQRRISKDGYQIVPVLYDLWKKNESSSFTGPSAAMVNPLDLRRIDQCVENLEYTGVTDFIADIQLMLKNVVQYCKYSYEVKYEARKFHDLFFDIMKIAFPDTDFREARNALTFPSHGGASSAAPPSKPTTAAAAAAAASQSKRPRMASEAEPTKPNPRGFATPDEEGRMTRAHVSKFQKGSRPDTGASGRDQAPPEPTLTHPGDLVICKKKRQDRRVGPVSPTSQGRTVPGPLSPPNSAGRLGPASPSSTSRSIRGTAQQKEAVHPAQQTMRWTTHPRQQQSSGGAGGLSPGVEEEVQWAKPVKRMRTDTGKRRPSHL